MNTRPPHGLSENAIKIMAGNSAVCTPQRSKTKNQTSAQKSFKLASFTSFSQIKELRPVMKTVRLDLLNEKKKKEVVNCHSPALLKSEKQKSN